MPKPWLLVSPASRGIGLHIARRLLQTTDLPVVATARNALQAVQTRILHGLDVDSERLQVLEVDVSGTISSRAITPTLGSMLRHVR